MGHMKDRALLEKKRVAGDSSFDVWSNYLFCPSLCRSCRYFSVEESNWPFHCKAPSTVAVSHVSRSQNYRQYDECPLYKEKVVAIKKSSSSIDDLGVNIFVGIFILIKSIVLLLIGYSNEKFEEQINKKSRIPKFIRVIKNILWTLFCICYLILLIAGWTMIFFDDTITNQEEKQNYIIGFSILTAIPLIVRIIKKVRKRNT